MAYSGSESRADEAMQLGECFNLSGPKVQHRGNSILEMASVDSPVLCRWRNCGAVFADAMDFQDHVLEHVVGKRSPYFNDFFCEWEGCSYGKSRTKSNLKSHVKSHAPARRHLCVNCGHRFEHLHDLTQHQLSRGHLPYDKIIEWNTASLCRFLSTKNIGFSEETLECVQKYGITGRSILHDIMPDQLLSLLGIEDEDVIDRLCRWLETYADMTDQHAALALVRKRRRLSGQRKMSGASTYTLESSKSSPQHTDPAGSPPFSACAALQRSMSEPWANRASPASRLGTLYPVPEGRENDSKTSAGDQAHTADLWKPQSTTSDDSAAWWSAVEGGYMRGLPLQGPSQTMWHASGTPRWSSPLSGSIFPYGRLPSGSIDQKKCSGLHSFVGDGKDCDEGDRYWAEQILGW